MCVWCLVCGGGGGGNTPTGHPCTLLYLSCRLPTQPPCAADRQVPIVVSVRRRCSFIWDISDVLLGCTHPRREFMLFLVAMSIFFSFFSHRMLISACNLVIVPEFDFTKNGDFHVRCILALVCTIRGQSQRSDHT